MVKVLFANGSGWSAQFHQLKTSRFLLLLDLRRLKPIQLGQALADWQAGVWRPFESKNWHQGQLNDRPVKSVHRFFELINLDSLPLCHSDILAIETIKNSWLEQHDDRCASTQCGSDGVEFTCHCCLSTSQFQYYFVEVHFSKVAPPFVVNGYWCDHLCSISIMRRTVSIVELPSSSSSSLSSNTACSSSAWPAATVRSVPLRSSTESELNKMGAGQSRRRPLDRTSVQCQPTIARTYQTLPQSSRRPLGNFRDDFGPPLSSSSTYSSSSDATLSYYPSPNKFPKTNPYVAARPRTDPKFGFATVRRVGPIVEEELTTTTTATGTTITTTTTSTSTTTDSAITGSRSSGTNSPSLQSSSCEQKAQMKRIVSGLKAFGIKGELYVSVILNRSLLTISADEARNLQPPPGSTSCNAYIRLSLMPDEEKRTQYKSEIVPGSNSPVFNQNVTFELLPEDSRKRLLISVWNRDCNTQKGGLLGCMAFSVRSILQTKQIEGWYYLLSPHYGRQKHLAVDKVNMLTYYGSIDCSKKSQHNNNNNHGYHRVGPIFL
ncbi:Regulator of G-protein signaling 3 [Trichinella pseudospiralis]|uniref:Regulator of G-protein signaling 3 n=1 Tax=Trichinella pseudospiralis TaxID=6337 RepID=A0A0V1F730_TRIPS|nr:Regulator of G-protein signaling 3 [Trichinella pseudospiralis]